MQTIPESPHPRRHWAAAMTVILLVSLLNLVGAATVQGRLIFRNGAPASEIGVRLTLGAKVITPFSFSVRDGRYFLKDVAPGAYTLEIWRNRVLVSKQPLTVREKITEVPVIKLP